jgi:translocation and assembly module TamB
VEGWTIERFVAAPVFDWPLVRVQGARLNFGNGSELVANGAWDFQAAELVGAELHGNIGATAVRQLLPAVVDFRNLQIDANAHGPLAALQHDGTIAATGVKASVLKPLDSKLVWVGRGASADISDGTVTAGKSRLQFAGKVDATGVELKTLEWTESSAERLTLREPAAVSWSPAIRVGPVKLRGPGGALELTAMFGETGRLQTTVRDFSSRWLGDFIDVPGPEWRVGHLDLEGSWDRGPAKFDLNGALTVTLAPERFADVTVAARTNPTNDAVLVEPLRVLEGDSAIVNATGEIPVAFYPATRPMLRFAPKAPLKLEATTASNPVFWKRLTEAIGVEFQEPEVNVNLGGTWENPRGEISARARRLAADSQRFKFSFPTIESLDVHATADGRKLDLDRLSVKVEGQALRANGMLPLSLERWPELRRAPLDFLRQEANLRLEIPDAEVAALSRYVGNYLAPAGNLHVDLQFNPGGEMSGALRLRNAATRPLGPLGVLQEVQVDAQLSGRDLVVKNVTAQAGGQPVTLSGKVEIPVGTPPRFDLALRAENFPLVRQTGLLMRADLDLRLKTQAGDVTAVTGEVNLRDSMFLSDVRALIPKGGGGGPTRRPPFFSIEFPPLDAWRLSVDVQGQEFLRLRSAVFVGTASARFHVGGTLGEPRATGEAVVETGQVLLPFATFQVEQGTVRLTEADPFSLQLFLTGQARRYGYDLRMELSGTASDPLVTFSSSPPLEAKEVLLMVTAGEVPRDEMTYGTAQRAAKLGTYLGQSLINNFGGDATDADRLTISTGERVSRQGRETYNIEYRINDRLTAIGEYDEFDAYNAGLKWRLFAPKRTERNPPKPPAPASPKKTNDAAR